MTDFLISLIKIKDRYCYYGQTRASKDGLSDLPLTLIGINAAPTPPAATAIALHIRNSGSLRKLPISS